MLFRCLLAWLPMPLIAIANGTLREYGIKKFIHSDAAANQISTLLLIMFLGIYIYLITPRMHYASINNAWLAGVVWILLTLAFEFGLGLATGKPLSELVDAYNLAKGNTWVFIPLWTLLAPVVFYKWGK